MRRITVEESTKAREQLNQLDEAVDMLAGMVIEAVDQNPQLLLSPYMRKLLIEKAKLVQSLHSPLKGRLYADVPDYSEPIETA